MAEKQKPSKRPEKKDAQKPRTREEAIRQMVEQDPKRAAELLRKILKDKS